MTEGPLSVEVRGVSKRYGAVTALDDVDFELRPGEVMALLGQNGAGKSTLVKVLSGLVAPDSGTVSIAGAPVALRSSSRSQGLGIAVVQQEYSSVPNLTIAENLVLGQASAPAVWSKRRLATQAREHLGRVGLAGLDPLTFVSELSVAERQLVEIARVLSRDARILLFDEPTAALSDAEIARVLGVVRSLAEDGRSIIYVTHRLPEVFAVADRVTIFRDGRSLAPVATSELDVDAIVTLMLGRKLDVLFPERSETSSDPLLVVDQLKSAGLSTPASLVVRSGEILGLTGQMGSGAGAPVRAIAGCDPVETGTVTVAGEQVSLAHRSSGIGSGIAYCSSDRQLDGIFAGLTIQKNLSSPWLGDVSRRGVLSPTAERRLAQDAATRFAIDVKRLGSDVATLSGGNQQKVALGRWTAGSARVLLVEEPTRGVDVGARAEIYHRLRLLCEQGLAVVVASSDTAEVFGLCDRIGTFSRGELTALRDHDEWTEAELVRQVMHSGAAGAA
ncbi:MAG TPA: sugar ABC transporter ATP-binding protein [Nocardioides sp.]|uniref:sugar ABC transporter ATP-binding protein n=1 Tax=uncultured Nocardioides sp. TaxID=198441 RepID=UPI0026078E88|nr:sugar ABC transporter ATP-binding protein [uncultured Nocardioides sp.]HRI94229.1 sugar ABC transporter ATP-binding protein [Nocardioides sp.]HRK44318.1 sugar ABC transporter ATP-binding protein [Nocardioides sp.]